MTSVDVAAISARCEAASPGPWTLGWAEKGGEPAATPVFQDSLDDPGFPVALAHLDRGHWYYNDFLADLVFVSHARADVPALLSALGVAEARAQEAEAALERVREANLIVHAHRFDLDNTPEEGRARLLALGVDEEPKGGPDNFYNGAEFAHKRIRAALHGVPSQPQGDPT